MISVFMRKMVLGRCLHGSGGGVRSHKGDVCIGMIAGAGDCCVGGDGEGEGRCIGLRIGAWVSCDGKDARRCHGLRVYPAGLKCVGVCVWRLGEDNLEVGDDE